MTSQLFRPATGRRKTFECPTCATRLQCLPPTEPPRCSHGDRSKRRPADMKEVTE